MKLTDHRGFSWMYGAGMNAVWDSVFKSCSSGGLLMPPGGENILLIQRRSQGPDVGLVEEVFSEDTESELTRFFLWPPTVIERLQSEQEREKQRIVHPEILNCNMSNVNKLYYLSNHWVWNVHSTSRLATVSSRFPSSNSEIKTQRALHGK